MPNKKLYVIIVSVFTIAGCSPRYGFYFCHTGFQPFGSFLLLQQDSTFVHQDWTEWYNLNSFGTWSPIPDKKNCIELKSSSSDYTHIPIHVAESKNDSNRTTIIFKQGAKFYNCQRNELVVNGKRIPIDRDTLILSDIKVDSLRIYLGESVSRG